MGSMQPPHRDHDLSVCKKSPSLSSSEQLSENNQDSNYYPYPAQPLFQLLSIKGPVIKYRGWGLEMGKSHTQNFLCPPQDREKFSRAPF